MSHRFTTLDGMRGIAAIAVMLFHFTHNTAPTLFRAADLAVDLFFCLSGFVIAYSYEGRLRSDMSVGIFLLKRLVRLYPMFIMGICIGAVALVARVAAGQASLTFPQTVTAIVLNSLYIPYFGDFYTQVGDKQSAGTLFPTNDPSWSLFFELAINVVFGVWIRHVRVSTPMVPVLFGAVTLSLYTAITQHIGVGWSASNFLGGFPRTIFGIFAGACIFKALQTLRRRLPVINPVLLLLLLVVMLSCAPNFHHLNTVVWLGDMLVLVPAFVVFGCLSNPENQFTRRVFDYLGWISYPIYCLHVPIMWLYILVTRTSNYGLQGLLYCTLITLAIAHLAAKYIEEPVRGKLSITVLRRKDPTTCEKTLSIDSSP